MHLASAERPAPALPAAAAPVWAIGGPRRLNREAIRLAEAAALALLDSGARLAVGCCTGTDAAVLMAAVQAGLADRLLVWSAFGPVPACTGAAAALAPGTCRWSAPAAVALAAADGARVQPWAGGTAEVPLSARLHRRTLAVAGGATGGVLVLLAPRSTGALLLARTAAHRLPVLALPVGCTAAALPPLAAGGAWGEPARGTAPLALPDARCWCPAQPALL
jgi:hypothetical protein